VIKAVRKFLFFSDSFCYYLRNQFDFPPLVAVGAGGHNSEHTVFRRGAAPEKIRTARTEGDNSGELKNVQNFTPDTKTSFNVKMGNPSGAWIFAGQNFTLKMRLVKMLK